jgi:hypothetical protein
MQAEYVTDIIFKKQEDLRVIYSERTATAIHTVKPDNMAAGNMLKSGNILT